MDIKTTLVVLRSMRDMYFTKSDKRKALNVAIKHLVYLERTIAADEGGK